MASFKLALSSPRPPPLSVLSPFYVVEVISGRVEQPVPMPLSVRRLHPLILPQQSYVLRASNPHPHPHHVTARSVCGGQGVRARRRGAKQQASTRPEREERRRRRRWRNKHGAAKRDERELIHCRPQEKTRLYQRGLGMGGVAEGCTLAWSLCTPWTSHACTSHS